MNTGCAGKTVRSLENACHTWAPQRCVHDKALYKSTFTLPYLTFYNVWPWYFCDSKHKLLCLNTLSKHHFIPWPCLIRIFTIWTTLTLERMSVPTASKTSQFLILKVHVVMWAWLILSNVTWLSTDQLTRHKAQNSQYNNTRNSSGDEIANVNHLYDEARHTEFTE